jgi:hypothetical protein
VESSDRAAAQVEESCASSDRTETLRNSADSERAVTALSREQAEVRAGSPTPTQPNGHSDRGPDGRFLPGNAAARQTGIYAQTQAPELREHVDRLTSGIVADLGGASELSTLEAAYVARLGDIETTLRLLAADIARRGLLTPSGGVRRVYDQLLAGIDRWDRLAQRLGMKRRARRLNVAEQIAQMHGQEDR